MKLLKLAIIALVFVLAAPSVFGQHYTITDLGPISPTGINMWGQVVGNLNGHAVLWTRGRRLRDLGLLPGGTFSSAAAINDRGVVTGTADMPGTVRGQLCKEVIQPFTWTKSNGMQGLGVIDSFGPPEIWILCDSYRAPGFFAAGLNAAGQVVGYTESRSTYQFGFLWTTVDGMTLLGNSWPPSFANGIDNKGLVVGQFSSRSAFLTPLVGHAASWKGGAMTDLGTLGGVDLDWGSSANAINELGEIVGWSTTTADDRLWNCSFSDPAELCPAIHAVLWTTGSGEIRDLGTLPGDRHSAAKKIDYFGQVIGVSGNGAVFSPPGYSVEVLGRPFIWSERLGMRDLNSLIRGNAKWVPFGARLWDRAR